MIYKYKIIVETLEELEEYDKTKINEIIEIGLRLAGHGINVITFEEVQE